MGKTQFIPHFRLPVVRGRMGAQRTAVPQRTGPPETVVRTILRDMRLEEAQAGVQGVAERRTHTVPGAAPGQRIQLLRVLRQEPHTYVCVRSARSGITETAPCRRVARVRLAARSNRGETRIGDGGVDMTAVAPKWGGENYRNRYLSELFLFSRPY